MAQVHGGSAKIEKEERGEERKAKAKRERERERGKERGSIGLKAFSVSEYPISRGRTVNLKLSIHFYVLGQLMCASDLNGNVTTLQLNCIRVSVTQCDEMFAVSKTK